MLKLIQTTWLGAPELAPPSTHSSTVFLPGGHFLHSLPCLSDQDAAFVYSAAIKEALDMSASSSEVHSLTDYDRDRVSWREQFHPHQLRSQEAKNIVETAINTCVLPHFRQVCAIHFNSYVTHPADQALHLRSTQVYPNLLQNWHIDSTHDQAVGISIRVWHGAPSPRRCN